MRRGEGGPVVLFLFFLLRGFLAGLVTPADLARRGVELSGVAAPEGECSEELSELH